MTLLEVLEKVKEVGLSKQDLEHYHLQLSTLYGQLSLEIADLKKQKAVAMLTGPEKSVAQRKIEFDVTKEGQRLIELDGYARASKTMLSSLKSRMYNFY